jgi:hypothetical protein
METEASASRRYGKKPGIAGFIGQRIFNRPFRKDVNAGMIAFGETDCDQDFLLASKRARLEHAYLAIAGGTSALG